MRPADRLEYAGTHYLEAAKCALLLLDVSGEQQGVGKPSSAAPVIAADHDKSGDPYNDDKINLNDADMADYCGSDRLKNVVCKYLEEQSIQNTEVMTATIRTFCRPKWPGETTLLRFTSRFPQLMMLTLYSKSWLTADWQCLYLEAVKVESN